MLKKEAEVRGNLLRRGKIYRKKEVKVIEGVASNTRLDPHSSTWVRKGQEGANNWLAGGGKAFLRGERT